MVVETMQREKLSYREAKPPYYFETAQSWLRAQSQNGAAIDERSRPYLPGQDEEVQVLQRRSRQDST